MKEKVKREYVLNRIFALSNKIQMLGDTLDTSITIKQVQLLDAVQKSDHGPLTVSELADQMGSSRQNVKKMASLLMNQGFLNMGRDEEDARIIRISLTDKGHAYFRTRNNVDKSFLNEIFDGVDEKLLKSMAKGFTRISKNVSEMERKAAPQA